MPQKLIAKVLVERMTDVDDVTNELISDPEVVRAVADALAQDERTAAYVIRVDSRHGVVVLRGGQLHLGLRLGLALGLTAALTATSWFLVERPALRWRRRFEVHQPEMQLAQSSRS